jgi:hypothetical protein
MQPIKYLNNWLEQNINSEHYLFTPNTLRALCCDLSNAAFKTLLSRAAHTGIFIRVCRGLYAFKKAILNNGLLLFHAAALLRSHELNYISLETALSDAGVISQIPINWISIMSSGRSNIINCGKLGTIEFVHTNKKPTDLVNKLNYDSNCRLWRANVSLALKDMKVTHRNCDLIDWDIADEFI